MTTNRDDPLRRLYGEFDRDHERLRSELMASLPASLPADISPARQAWRWIGESKMRRRLIGSSALATALAAAVLVIAFWPGKNGSGRVYGMTDLADLFKDAGTIHIEGWTYLPPVPPPGQEQARCRIEAWANLAEARQRQRSSSYAITGSDAAIEETEHIADGEFALDINHTRRTARYSRINPFQARLNARRSFDELFKSMFGDPVAMEGAKKTGAEELDGRAYDVWEYDVELRPGAEMSTTLKMNCSIEPRTGEIGRVRTWMRQQQVHPDQWFPVMEITRIERNLVIPPEIFRTAVPEGYTIEVSKEDAPMSMLSLAGGLRLGPLSISKYVEFRLEDGSILVGWSSQDSKADADQSELFAGIEFGGALPKLPLEIYALKPMSADSAATLTGHHLTHTKWKGLWIEWSLYVPDRKLPFRNRFVGFQALHRYNSPNREQASGTIGVSGDLEIRNKKDFDDLVLGAMAELSDSHAPPPRITYETVLGLAQRLKTQASD